MLYAIANQILTVAKQILSVAMNCLAILKRVDAHLDDLAKHQLGLGLAVESQGKQLAEILTAVTPRPAVGFRFTFELEGQFIEGVENLTIKDNQKFTASIQPVDAKGNPASVDG